MTIGTKNGITYYSDMKNMRSILSPVINNDVNMGYRGHFASNWDKYSVTFDSFGYGLKKTRANQGAIYCQDASKLFSLDKGYVGMVMSFPNSINSGRYMPLINSTVDITEHLVWGINVGKVNSEMPCVYSSLTKNGIEFTVWSSYCKYTLIDNITNISSNSNALIEFIWDNNGLFEYMTDDGYKPTMCIRINSEDIVVADPPIANDDISDLSFYALETPFVYSNLECTIRRLVVGNEVPRIIEDEWYSSSSSSSISSSSSSSFDGWVKSFDGTGMGTGLAWFTVDCSYDGSSVVAAMAVSGDIYGSLDYGGVWSNLSESIGEVTDGWTSVSISYDGNTMVACNSRSNGLYISLDNGNNWTKPSTIPRFIGHTPVFSRVKCALNGQKMFAFEGDYVHRTIDAGSNWLPSIKISGSFTDGYVNSIDCSEDGNILIASVYYEDSILDGYIFTSSDGGVTWNRMTSLAAGNGSSIYNMVACSSNGEQMYVMGRLNILTGYQLQHSSTAGNIFQTVNDLPFLSERAGVDCSSDGKRIIVFSTSNSPQETKLYVSNDGPTTYNAPTEMSFEKENILLNNVYGFPNQQNVKVAGSGDFAVLLTIPSIYTKHF